MSYASGSHEAEPRLFPTGGRAGLRYRGMLVRIVDLVFEEYGDEEWIDEIFDHLAEDLLHRNSPPWSGVRS